MGGVLLELRTLMKYHSRYLFLFTWFEFDFPTLKN